MSKKTEIQALIKLLDDDDDQIIEKVTSKLLSYGEEVVFNLENSWENTFNPVLHERIEDLIQKIQFSVVYKELRIWLSEPHPELLVGAKIVAKYQFPDIDFHELKNKIEGIKQKIWLELNNDLTPLETVNVINHIFYGYLQFKGSYTTKPDINDYCINVVLETKKGSSILLGIVYMIIAQDLNIPIYGVNLYKHFVLSYQKKFISDFTIDNSKDSMFYLNQMNKGIVFERDEIKKYLEKQQKDPSDSDFAPASSKQVIKELLFYIFNYYTVSNQELKANHVEELIELFNP